MDDMSLILYAKLKQKASLVNGKIPEEQLPSYVDDVIEVDSFSDLPQPGESGKIYVTIDTNKSYRWSGSTYAEIGSGSSYTAGDGIKINNSEISVDFDTVASNDSVDDKLDSKQDTMSAYDGADKVVGSVVIGKGLVITSDNKIARNVDIIPSIDYVDGSISDTIAWFQQELDNEHAGRVAGDNLKQDKITDLDNIRSGAQLGSTAVQPEEGKGLFSGDYEDLTNKPSIPTQLSQLTADSSHRLVTDTEKTGWDSKYDKPVNGIAEADLSSGVQTSLGLANTALQEVPDTYRTAEDQDIIDAAKQDVLVSGTNIKTINTQSLIGPGNVEIQELWQSGQGNYSIQTKGTGCDARGQYSVAEGWATFTESDLSHAEGWATRTIIDDSDTDSHGHASHAEGSYTIAKGAASHAEGNTTESMGRYSHAEGSGSISGGRSSHAEGEGTIAENVAEHAEGSYNKSHSVNAGDSADTLHSIGIGTSMTNRLNAEEIMSNGDVFMLNIGNYNGTNIDEAQTLQEVISSLISRIEALENK